jgi:hypothetical protein
VNELNIWNPDGSIATIAFTLTLNVEQLKATLDSLKDDGFITDWAIEHVHIPDDEDLADQLWRQYAKSKGVKA